MIIYRARWCPNKTSALFRFLQVPLDPALISDLSHLSSGMQRAFSHTHLRDVSTAIIEIFPEVTLYEVLC